MALSAARRTSTLLPPGAPPRPPQALIQNNQANARRLLGVEHADFKAVMNRWAKPISEGGDKWMYPVLGIEARAVAPPAPGAPRLPAALPPGRPKP